MIFPGVIHVIGFVIHLMFRFKSYINENTDILTHLGWTSDPLLLWEKDFGQKIKAGNMRPKGRKEREVEGLLEEEEEQEVEVVVVAFPPVQGD